MLIALAGLPGTGKSTLAACLSAQLGGVVLCKDVVRAALFPPPILNYSSAEDEISMDAVFSAAAYIRKNFPEKAVLIDGRTFLRSYQIQDLRALGESLGEPIRIIECVCTDAVARQRLERDLSEGRHPAVNRTYDLYRAVRERADPILLPHLVIDTTTRTLDECVQECLGYLKECPDGR